MYGCIQILVKICRGVQTIYEYKFAIAVFQRLFINVLKNWYQIYKTGIIAKVCDHKDIAFLLWDIFCGACSQRQKSILIRYIYMYS